MVLKRLLLFFTLLMSVSAYATTEIKFAIVAPEGSAWANVLHEWNDELKAKTAGRVALKIYAGGVLGDEQDVIRKMRIGQVHAAGLTGLGMGLINPTVRILDLPLLTENYAEADAVSQRLQPKLEAGFAPKGFLLLGWIETGFVNIFSNRPVASRKDMDGIRMWAWEGDPLVDALYRRFKIVPVPLALADVLTSLQTNLIDAVYAPPLGAIALQWFTRAKYITNVKLADSTGGIVITQQAFMTLASGDRQILQETARKYARLLVERTRVDNEKSYATLVKAGLQMVEVKPDDLAYLRETSQQVWDDLAGKLYPPELLTEAKVVLAELRKTH